MSSEGTRLNKYLASCGVGSRRACDALIFEGKVSLNDHICINPATRVTSADSIKVGRKPVRPLLTTTIVFNKPRGFVCTKKDELNRPIIYDLLPQRLQHLNHVGRLDQDSEGLLILTNDGELAQALTHPKKHIEKEYLVTTLNSYENELIDRFKAGVYTTEGKASAKAVRRLSSRRLQVVLVTGLKRQIRLMCSTLGHRVKKLVRVRIGSFWDHEIPTGKWRALEEDEIKLLLINPRPAKKKYRGS